MERGVTRLTGKESRRELSGEEGGEHISEGDAPVDLCEAKLEAELVGVAKGHGKASKADWWWQAQQELTQLSDPHRPDGAAKVFRTAFQLEHRVEHARVPVDPNRLKGGKDVPLEVLA